MSREMRSATITIAVAGVMGVAVGAMTGFEIARANAPGLSGARMATQFTDMVLEEARMENAGKGSISFSTKLDIRISGPVLIFGAGDKKREISLHKDLYEKVYVDRDGDGIVDIDDWEAVRPLAKELGSWAVENSFEPATVISPDDHK